MRSGRGSVAAWGPWVLAVVIGALFVVSACRDIGNFLEDDPLISLRYSQRLLEGKGLTWTDGERVEGYSNLSQVLIVAALGVTGMDLIDALRVFTVGSMLVAFVMAMLFARRLGAGWAGTTLAMVLLGSSASISIWTIAGLEQPFVLACLCAALWFLAEFQASGFNDFVWVRRAGVSLALLVWTRPDSPLFVALFALGVLVLLGRRHLWAAPRALALVVGVPLTAWAAQLVFRLAYYGEWVPNTAFVKAHVTEARVRLGFDYLRSGFETNSLLTGAMLVALVLGLIGRATRRWTLLLSGLIVVWSLYVAAVGGDHFPGWRHLVPVWGLAVMMVALGFAALGRWRWLAWLRPVLVVVTLFLVPASIARQWSRHENGVTRVARWQWEGESVGLLFGTAFEREQPLYAITAAGCLPYFSKLPSLDMLGLNDKHIARQPADPRMPVGHDHGDGKYVLKRAPDLITFNMPRGNYPGYTTGEQMAADPSFARDYLRIPFQALEPLAMISESYVRVAGRIGVKATDGAVQVPAYLFQPSRGVPMPDRGMGTIVFAGEVARWTHPPLGVGQWRVELVPPNPRVEVSAVAARPLEADAVSYSGGVLTVRRAGPVTLSLGSPDAVTVVGAVTLTPVAEGEVVPSPPLRPSERGAQVALTADAEFKPWTLTGDAFGRGLAEGPRRGQGPISGNEGPFFNSFADSTPEHGGDWFRGTLSSQTFLATSTTTLRFRVGGGRAEGFDTQVGVRIVERLRSGERRVRFVVTGERDEVLRPVKLDLGWLAGRALFVELFDDAQGGWGHVLAGNFVLSD